MSQVSAGSQLQGQALDYFVSKERTPRLAPLATSVFVVVAGFIVLELGTEIFRRSRDVWHVPASRLNVTYYVLIVLSVAACAGLLFLARALRRGSSAAIIGAISALSLGAVACLMVLARIYDAHFDRATLGGLIPFVSFLIYVAPIPLLVRMLKEQGADMPLALAGRVELGRIFDESFLSAVLLGKLAMAALPWTGKAAAILAMRHVRLSPPQAFVLQLRRVLLGDHTGITLFALALVVAAVTVLIIRLRGDRETPPLRRIALRYAILYAGFILLLELPLYLRFLTK